MISKMCPRCHNIIGRNDKLCDECTIKDKENNRNRYKEYDNTKRDDKCSKFYKSKEWLMTRTSVLFRDNNMCRVCWSRDKKIKVGDTAHHIITLRDDWSLRVDKNNLITVCPSCHKIIHDFYKSKNKNNMIDILKNIIKNI